MTGGRENNHESAILLSNTGPSIVCTCLVVFETLVPMHSLQLQMLYPTNPFFPLVCGEKHESTFGSE